MKDFNQLRDGASKKFGDDPDKMSVANKALAFTEQWVNENSYTGNNLSNYKIAQKKQDCNKYVTAKLLEDREANGEEYGLLGTLLGAIAFQLVVQLVVRWIMNNYFTK